MEEIWKKIKFSDKYEISNLGRLRTNVDPYKHIKTDKYRIIKGTKNQYGYVRTILRDNGKIKNASIHRLVLETFNPIENMDELQVNHKNWKRDDNRLENLEWVTPKENMNKLSEFIRYNSKAVYDEYGNRFESYREAAEKYNIAPNTIRYDIRNKRKKETRVNRPRFYSEEEYKNMKGE